MLKETLASILEASVPAQPVIDTKGTVVSKPSAGVPGAISTKNVDPALKAAPVILNSLLQMRKIMGNMVGTAIALNKAIKPAIPAKPPMTEALIPEKQAKDLIAHLGSILKPRVQQSRITGNPQAPEDVIAKKNLMSAALGDIEDLRDLSDQLYQTMVISSDPKIRQMANIIESVEVVLAPAKGKLNQILNKLSNGEELEPGEEIEMLKDLFNGLDRAADKMIQTAQALAGMPVT